MNEHFSLALLESALAGNLPADNETALNHHLASCEACSTALERLAGGTDWCEEAAALLATDELDMTLPTCDKWSEVDFTVEHLEPADEPNLLGRLGGYDVLQIIGHGGMGVVLKAFDRELKRAVAIKVLAPHLAQSALAKQRFAREAQASAAIVHPNVLAIHQVQAGGRLPFLVMPLVAGESLAERLTAQGTLELKEILRIGMQAAAGLAAAHEQGLVHRDVKPANILLEKGVERAVLTDFGLARAADDVALTRWGIIAGTPQYMSPEQARGEPLNGRSDLFSLGCVLYEMATGVSPFRADSMLATMRRLVDDPPQAMEAINPELPPWFIAIVNRLLEKEPARRFSSAAEVSQLLEGCLAHLQQPAHVPPPEGLPAKSPPPMAMKRTIFGRKTIRRIGVFLGLVLLTIGAIGAFMFGTADPPDIAGQWTSDEWGAVQLKQNGAGEYSGTYSIVGKEPGKIEVKWSRIERQFTGTWNEGKNRFGNISIHLADDGIRGAWTTDRKSKINPATPTLADLHWVRPKADSPTGWTFKPEVNKGIGTTRTPVSNALRLSDGHVFNLPKKSPGEKDGGSDMSHEEFAKWLSDTGVHFAIEYHWQTDQWEMKLRNVKFAQLPDDDWKTLTADELHKRFPNLKWKTPENLEAQQKETGFYSLEFGTGITPPLTFAFETSEGARGIFQFSGSQHGVHAATAIEQTFLRYKQLQPKDASTKETDRADAASNQPVTGSQSEQSRASGENVDRSTWTFATKAVTMFTTSSKLSSDTLRLSDGHLFNLPKPTADKNGSSSAPTKDEREKWLAETVVNFAIDYHQPADQWELKLRNVRFAQLPDDDWQSLTAKQLQSQFSTLKWNTPENHDAEQKEAGFYSLNFSRGITPPMTFAFETDDGERGILQFVATNITSTGVNAIIRLKRLQQKEASNIEANSDETAAQPLPDSAEPQRSISSEKLSFGPVVERTLNYSPKGPNNVLTFATGELVTMPYDPLQEYQSKIAWIKTHDADILASERSSLPSLAIVGGAALRRPNWDATPAEVANEIDELERRFESFGRRGNTQIGWRDSGALMRPNGSEWTTYHFRSRNGTIGILQFAKSTDSPNSVIVRYKLAQPQARKTSRPATREDQQSGQSFGPILERTLNDISIGSSNSALNLATGERLSPDAREFENAMTWAKANGADLIACSDGGGRGLRVIGGLAVEPADWNASPLEATEAVANMENGIEKYKREIPSFQDPRTMGFSNLWFKGTEESSTYYIKTKDGTVGVLQINRLKDYPRSVEFRYKLLQTATPKYEKTDGTGGIHTDVGQEKSIADVVRQFNTRAEWDQIGKDQPPLTEDELRGAIYSLTHSENDRFSTDEKQELEKAAASGVLPKDWQLEVFTKIGGALGERFQEWMIYLSKHRADSKQGFLVRQQLLCQLDEDGKLAPLPDRRKLNQSDDGATPLAAAINGFNSAHHTVWNVRQKPLTEEEVVAAIRWWKTRRNDAPVPNGEFAQFQKIADTRALPQGAEFEVIPDFIYGDGTEHFIWSVRIRMPQQSKPGWTFAYEIRRQYVHSEGIDDVKRKEQTIAWGVAASNGLQAGVRLEPHSETYAAGERVTPIFYYRNVGKATLQTSFPNLMTHSYYSKLIAVDTAEKPFTIDQDPNTTGPVGWIEEPLAPGAQHEIKGLPIVLGDVDRGDAETVIRASAGDSVHLRFDLPNPVEKNAPPLPTGEVIFSTK